MSLIKTLYAKYKEIILYLFFGALTTLVNIASYAVCAHLLKLGWEVSNVIAFVLSVLFAYVTNRRYIFESKKQNVIKEIALFFFFRILSLGIDMVCMYLILDVIEMQDLIAKIAVQVIVIVLNYLFSKLIVFAK